MQQGTPDDLSESPWTLKKAVTTLAIAPQTESLTRTGRMAYNLMIYKAQRMEPAEDGGYSSPLSEIIKGFGSTTRDSTRVRTYIEQMCTTLVRWFPLSRSDDLDRADDRQASLVGLEPVVDAGEGRVFTLLSEARWAKRAGETWVTWYFPPTIREMVIEPSRWAQLDIKEMAKLSHYASVALYEVCSRYKDVPGGLTNKADPSFWAQTLRPDPETKPREWRKFKNETLKPAIAEICQQTGLDIEVVEERKGRAVVGVQFQVRRKAVEQVVSSIDLTMVQQASELGVKERDLDQLVEEHGEEQVRRSLLAMSGRNLAQPAVPIKHPVAYLRKALRAGRTEPLFETRDQEAPSPAAVPIGQELEEGGEWLAQRRREVNDALDELSVEELQRYVDAARTSLAEKGFLTAAMQKRFEQRQYRSPMIWEYIRNAFAEARFGQAWKIRPAIA